MKLLLDEQISGKVAEMLREQGHDVVGVAEDPTMRGRSDAGIFETAQRLDRAVVTYNRDDFEDVIRAFAGEAREHHGLVIVPSWRLRSDGFSRLAKALAALLDGPDFGGSFVIWLQEAK